MIEIRKTYNEFPKNYWVLVGATLIDSVGATLIFPFFALYITQKFHVGMTQAGILACHLFCCGARGQRF